MCSGYVNVECRSAATGIYLGITRKNRKEVRNRIRDRI